MLSIEHNSFDLILQNYQIWLENQPLSVHTRRAYFSRVSRFCRFLQARQKTNHVLYGDPLEDKNARDFAVRDFRVELLGMQGQSPASVNLSLAALDQFFRFLGLGSANCKREETTRLAPQSLELADQKHLLRVVKACASVRDRAIVLLLLYTGLRLGECVALNLEDVSLTPRKPILKVRLGKGNSYREVPLNSQLREALQDWLAQRQARESKPSASSTKQADAASTPFFLNKSGNRLTARALDLRLRQLAAQANLTFSAHTLRHTCLTNLVRAGYDLVLVAEIAGHKRLETTRRYSLPNQKDKVAALASLELEI